MTPDEHRAEALRLASDALRGALDQRDGAQRVALVAIVHAILGGPWWPVPAEDRELAAAVGGAGHPSVPWQVTKAKRDAQRIKDLLATGEDPGQAASLETDLLAATARAVVAGHPWARDMAVEAVAVLDTPGTRWAG